MKVTTINVEDIPCYVGVGCHEEERTMGQMLYINVHLEINSMGAVSSDNVSNGISYVDIYNIVQRIGNEQKYHLIETIGERIAEELLKIAITTKVKIKVKKRHIPFKGFQGNVSIELERTK